MSATRGPIPKRSEERRRRNKGEPVDSLLVIGDVEVPPPAESWHPIAADWYASLSMSGQARFFEPSDWQGARLVAESMTRMLEAHRFSAQAFAAIWSAMSELLTTEGARRRARMEIERQVGDDGPPASITAIEHYRRALEG
jgi:hypothetical protein